MSFIYFLKAAFYYDIDCNKDFSFLAICLMKSEYDLQPFGIAKAYNDIVPK